MLVPNRRQVVWGAAAVSAGAGAAGSIDAATIVGIAAASAAAGLAAGTGGRREKVLISSRYPHIMQPRVGIAPLPRLI